MNLEWFSIFAASMWKGAGPIFWQSSLVIAGALLAVWLLRRRSAPVRYAILLLALLKLVVPPIAVDLPVAIPKRFGEVKSRVETVRPEIQTRGIAPARGDVQELTVTEAAAVPHQPGFFPRADWQSVLGILYAGGLLLGLGALARSYWIVTGIIRRGEHVRDREVNRIFDEVRQKLGLARGELLYSDEVESPAVAGLFRPVILLPKGVRFDVEELRTILAHESAHLRRWDLFVDFAQRLIQVLWWFHPLVHLLNRKMRSVREECCDELLVARKAMPPENYCRALLSAARKLAVSRAGLPMLGILSREHPIGTRIARLMGRQTHPAGRLTWLQAIVISLIACAIVPNLRAEREGSRAAGKTGFADFAPIWNDAFGLKLVMNGANLDGVNWRNRNLQGAALCNTSLKNAVLAGANLNGANLAGANLEGADLRGAELEGADFTGANLREAQLNGAILRRAWLAGADLDGANLENATLDFAFLRGTKISTATALAGKWRTVIAMLAGDTVVTKGADLSNANLSKLLLPRGDLSRANLSGADLSHADLRETTFQGADLTGANLERSTIEKGDFRGAEMSDAHMAKARLREANFAGAVLRSANLTGANLEKAHLEDTDFDQADLNGARLASARLTSGTKLGAKWRLAKALQEGGAAGRNLAGADLSGMDLSRISFLGADLAGANLENTILQGSDLSGANLVRARLEGALLGVTTDAKTRLHEKWQKVNALVIEGGRRMDLTGIDLSGANLANVQLEGAKLRGANLDRAILDGTNFQAADLEGSTTHNAKFYNTIMPDGSVRTDEC